MIIIEKTFLDACSINEPCIRSDSCKAASWPHVKLFTVSPHVKTTRTDLCSVRGKQGKQLGWQLSTWDSFKQSTTLAMTLWPKVSFPGASPMRTKLHDHNKSPSLDMNVINPLVLNLCPHLHAESPLHKNQKKKNKKQLACQKYFLINTLPLPLLSEIPLVKGLYKYWGIRSATR